MSESQLPHIQIKKLNGTNDTLNSKVLLLLLASATSHQQFKLSIRWEARWKTERELQGVTMTERSSWFLVVKEDQGCQKSCSGHLNVLVIQFDSTGEKKKKGKIVYRYPLPHIALRVLPAFPVRLARRRADHQLVLHLANKPCSSASMAAEPT